MKRILLYHGLPFILACAILYLASAFIQNKLITCPGKSIEKFPFPAYFANYRDDYNVEDSVCYSLWRGSSIVVMGSSEMTLSQFPAIPYNFFKCVGVGHEGNQCFSIYSQLCAMNRNLGYARLVIILSPGWFCGDYANGTSLESFLEFNSERFLYNSYYSASLPDSFKIYIGNYIAGKFSDIESPSAIIKAFYYDNLSGRNILNKVIYSPFRYLYHSYCDYKIRKTEHLVAQEKFEHSLISYCSDNTGGKEEKPLSKMQHPHWDSLFASATKEFALKSTNNKMGIDNDYYNKWIKKYQLKHLNIIAVDESKEMKDFKMMVQLLRYYNSDVYFIIQPLNPLAHDNLVELTPVISEIKNELDKNNFGYYNMFTTDTTHYIKGTLTDVMHLGNLGWYKADSAIYSHFYK